MFWQELWLGILGLLTVLGTVAQDLPETTVTGPLLGPM